MSLSPEKPQIVGAVASLRALGPVDQLPLDAFDVVEIRLHQDDTKDNSWTAIPRAFAQRRKPTLLTLRVKEEGGTWDDATRKPVFAAGLPHVAAIDVELGSNILSDVVAMAREHGVTAIGSFHDFAGTPPLDQLLRLLRKAKDEKLDVLKVAAMVNGADDLWTLTSFLQESQKEIPVCIIGMGQRGLSTRVFFPLIGSCLTYGYLGESTAPGQLSCVRMRELLKELGMGGR
ncbi:type I 3-dehydroquinate dehydratase [Candidatus Sumerlaeota bacterium]|nr:type I 3-dehydroquinate dehydratase [Candidatus Sumerlaeota bacterium]